MKKVFKLCLILIFVVQATRTEEVRAEMQDDKEEEGEVIMASGKEDEKDLPDSLEHEDTSSSSDDDADDVAGRNMEKIELLTNDARCNEIGVCSGLHYGDKYVVVSFDKKLKVSITSKATYEVAEPRNYTSLTFVNSQFANFPLQLFYSFQVQELDFRNCSLKTLKWDNFLSADKLSILLLSENLLEDLKPSLFSLAENLVFLFLDSNRIQFLYDDSFKGLHKLNFLDLNNNLIEILPKKIFSYLPALQQINLANNRLQIVEQNLFVNNPRLFSIHLHHNALQEIQDYAFQQQTIIKYLDISHNSQMEVLVVANIRVENLWARNCSLQRVNIYGEAVHVDLQQNSIKELYFNDPESLETLRLKDNKLEQISSLSLSTNLITLDLSNNPGLKILPDVMQINSLERLDLSNTFLKEVPLSLLSSPSRLRSLNVSYNRVEEINPLNFKYLKKLSQFYIHHNNWNCYNLKILMDVIIKPLKISYTHDDYDENFAGEYINGIQCMYRVEQADDEYYVDFVDAQSLDSSPKPQAALNEASPSSKLSERNQLQFENTQEVENLRRELKAIVGVYEQKFAFVLNKLNQMDLRLQEFERFNRTVWKEVAIVV